MNSARCTVLLCKIVCVYMATTAAAPDSDCCRGNTCPTRGFLVALRSTTIRFRVNFAAIRPRKVAFLLNASCYRYYFHTTPSMSILYDRRSILIPPPSNNHVHNTHKQSVIIYYAHCKLL